MNQRNPIVFFVVLVLCLKLVAASQDVYKLLKNMGDQLEEIMDSINDHHRDIKRETTEQQNQILQKLKRQQNAYTAIRQAMQKQEEKINFLHLQISGIESMMVQLISRTKKGNTLLLDIVRKNPNLNRMSRVAALPWPSQGALVASLGQGKDEIIRVDQTGRAIDIPYTNNNEFNPVKTVSGLLLHNGLLYILHRNGKIISIDYEKNKVISTYNVDVGELTHTGELGDIDTGIPDTLHLVDKKRGEVFTYNYKTNTKLVRVRDLQEPVSVTYVANNELQRYVVSEEGAGLVKIYNTSWVYQQTLRPDPEQYKEFIPKATITSPQNTILVVDAANTVVFEYNINGRPLRTILRESDGIEQPIAMSQSQGRLWIACNANTFATVKAFRVFS